MGSAHLIRIVTLGESGVSFAALTELLHRGYGIHAAAGLNFTALAQDESVTRARANDGECFVALQGSRLVGTVTLRRAAAGGPCETYRRPGLPIVAQFAVEPDLHGRGVGSLLLAHAEDRARELGASEVALDTAEPARDLLAFYLRRGYEPVESVRWEGKTYTSVVLLKKLS